MRTAGWTRSVLLAVAATGAGSGASSPSLSQQAPTFGATVARIRVDVVVTDGDGRFVEGLRAGDFRLFEDDEEREILAVELVDAHRGVARDVGGAAARTSATDVVEPVAAAPSATTDLEDGSAALIFVVDLPGMDWRNKARFASAWRELLEATERPGMPRAVYLIDQVGRLRELAPLGYEIARLREAATRIHDEPLTRTSMQERLASESEDAETDLERRARARATLGLLTQFCKALAARGGRTALVWITSELQITRVGPAVVGLTGDLPWGAMAPDPLVRERLEELYRAANSANVSIYTLDPTPVQELHGIGFDVQNRSADRAVELAAGAQYGLNALRDGLRNVAERTGGRALLHWANPADALNAIENDTSRFYLLTYANPAPIGDGRYHRIRVEVTDPSWDVRERSGYTDYPVDELESRLLSGALNLPGTVAAPALGADAIRKWSPSGEPIVQMAVDLATGGPPSGGSEFELHGLAVREDGRVQDSFEERVRPASDLGMPPAYVRDWGLPQGEYELHLVLRDPSTGHMRATSVPVVLPAATKEWATSDVILVIADDAGRPVPLIGTVVPGDRTLAAYVEVVFGRAPIISGDLFRGDGGERIAQFAPAALVASADGLFRGDLRVTGIPPGEYLLQVTVTDAVAGKHRILRQPLRVLQR